MILDLILAGTRRTGEGPVPPLAEDLAAGAPEAVRISPAAWQAVLESGLLAAVRASGERVVSGERLLRIDRIRDHPRAEYSRLYAKGRTLYEHCMIEPSHACVIGFFDHELGKSRNAERVVFDLLGWIAECRDAMREAFAGEGDDALRIQHSEVMMDHAVSYLFGLSREAANRLADGKVPLD